jgi:dUTP pyrophosphatase
MKQIYLAEPIDLTDGADSHTDLIAQCLRNKTDVGLYRPRTAWSIQHGTGPDPRVESVNRVALMCADAVVAHLPSGRASIGVPMEIEAAAHTGIPVVVIGGNGSFALERRGVTRVANLTDLLDWVEALQPRAQRDPADARTMKVAIDRAGAMPSRAHYDDAGLDLYVSEDTMIIPGVYTDVPTGISVQLPPDTFGMIVGRSSTSRKRGLQVQTGIIDAGYRGPLFAQVLGTRGMLVQKGERLAQMLILKNTTMDVSVVQAAELDEHARGHNGFGSSGA